MSATPSTPPAPPGPPPTPSVDPSPSGTLASLLSLGRSLALLMALLAGVLFLVFLVLSILNIVFHQTAGDIVTAVYCLASAVVNYIAWQEIPRLERFAAARQYGALRDHMLVWVILGVLFFVVVGIVLAIAWIKADQLARPSGAASPPPPPSSAGGSGSPPACPKCGNPTTWIPEYRRYYCYRDSSYV